MQSDDLGLAAKLLELISSDDHERLCQGREYSCSCGYDERKDAALREAAAAIERLVAERDEARRRIELLTAGINGVVNFQSPLTRAQVREAMSDLLESTGSRPWTTEDQSPFAARAGRLAEALKAIRGGVRTDGHVWIDCGNGGLESGPTIGEFIDQALKDAP